MVCRKKKCSVYKLGIFCEWGEITCKSHCTHNSTTCLLLTNYKVFKAVCRRREFYKYCTYLFHHFVSAAKPLTSNVVWWKGGVGRTRAEAPVVDTLNCRLVCVCVCNECFGATHSRSWFTAWFKTRGSYWTPFASFYQTCDAIRFETPGSSQNERVTAHFPVSL